MISDLSASKLEEGLTGLMLMTDTSTSIMHSLTGIMDHQPTTQNLKIIQEGAANDTPLLYPTVGIGADNSLCLNPIGRLNVPMGDPKQKD